MNPPPKRHHTVPKLYLKRFSPNEEQLGVFNKATGKAYTSPLDDVCVEKHFYKSDGGVTVKDAEGAEYDLTGTFIENPLLTDFEHLYEPNLKEFIEHVACRKKIEQKHKDALSVHIGLQWFRTGKWRSELERMPNSLADQIAASWGGAELPEPLGTQLRMLREEGSKAGAKKHHLTGMLDPGLWRVYEAAVRERHWCVAVNKTGIPYYTSDSPVVIMPKGMGMERSGHITAIKSELVFPLTPEYLLLAYCPLLKMDSFNNKVFNARRCEVFHYNHAQYQSCQRLLVVGRPEFEIAQDMHKLSNDEFEMKYDL